MPLPGTSSEKCQISDRNSFRGWVLFSWIAPDRKSHKKGGIRLRVRVIEYTIDTDAGQQTYRLITSLMDIALFPALLLATEYHDSMGNRKHN